MFLSIRETGKVFRLIKKNKYYKAWISLYYLMIAFLFGYGFVIILLYFKIYGLILLLTGVIFLLGSIFVFLVVKTEFLTIKDLLKTNQQLLDINTIKIQLEKDKETAQEIAKLKSEFLSTLSHELLTPMNGIISMTDLLFDTDLDEQQDEFLKIIQESGNNLLVIINDILDFSKLESGKITVTEHHFELKNCLNLVFDLILPEAESKGLQLSYKIEPDVPLFIDTDIYRLRQILVNIIGNAIKFTHQGEIFVSVKNIEKKKILFSIKDTGIGIPPERLNQLFQPFSQVDSSLSRKFGGTGLGLAICKKLIELMGGDIWVESEINQGSTFFFTIQSKLSSIPDN